MKKVDMNYFKCVVAAQLRKAADALCPLEETVAAPLKVTVKVKES